MTYGAPNYNQCQENDCFAYAPFCRERDGKGVRRQRRYCKPHDNTFRRDFHRQRLTPQEIRDRLLY